MHDDVCDAWTRKIECLISRSKEERARETESKRSGNVLTTFIYKNEEYVIGNEFQFSKSITKEKKHAGKKKAWKKVRVVTDRNGGSKLRKIDVA